MSNEQERINKNSIVNGDCYYIMLYLYGWRYSFLFFRSYTQGDSFKGRNDPIITN